MRCVSIITRYLKGAGGGPTPKICVFCFIVFSDRVGLPDDASF